MFQCSKKAVFVPEKNQMKKDFGTRFGTTWNNPGTNLEHDPQTLPPSDLALEPGLGSSTALLYSTLD
jgi:hypothetical protein